MAVGIIEFPLGYEKLFDELSQVMNRAAYGKGAERHANNKPFHEQPIATITEHQGHGFIRGQIEKKAIELSAISSISPPNKVIEELLDIAVYALADAIILRKEHEITLDVSHQLNFTKGNTKYAEMSLQDFVDAISESLV